MPTKYTLKTWAWVAFLLLAGVVTRWLPHPPNFSAFLAVSLFAGLILPGPLALLVPIAGMFMGDLFLGFHDLTWVVYLSLLPVVWMGRLLPEIAARKPATWLGWGLAGLVAALFFFVTTNLAVWWTSGMYSHTSDGLITCFVLAIPYFHNSLISTWVFLTGFEVVRRLEPLVLPAAAVDSVK